jgi:succinyl-diaminopimelate desuccinylase
MVMVRHWTGYETRALREAMRLGVRDFAAKLGVAVRTVTKWEMQGARAALRPESHALLDTLLARASRDVQDLFELSIRAVAADPHVATARVPADQGLALITSGSELSAALIAVVRGARECLVAVGSRSREPGYLREIEQAVREWPTMIHYRILIGLPHTQILKDHLLRLLALRPITAGDDDGKSLYLSILDDLVADPERFFVASEHTALVMLPSATSPANFDTALLVRDPTYVDGLLQHGKALYGRRRLETVEAYRLSGGVAMSYLRPTPQPVTDSVRNVIRRWAREDHAGVLALLRQLVRIPSRGGLDPYEPIVALATRQLADRQLMPRRLRDPIGGAVVGVVCDVSGAHPGPRFVLDACLDTAPFGDLLAWRYAPTSAAVEDGWLYGRGAADSKAAVAIFTHLAARLRAQAADLHGTLTVLFDADEHTGAFGGAKTYFAGPDAPADVAGVMIGYPGTDQIVVGGRGFLRATLTVRARAGHTGSERAPNTANAVDKAAALVNHLTTHRVPGPTDPTLGLPPRLTVTAIHGGESYSIIPDYCTIDVDVRLTATFDQIAGQALIEQSAALIDAQHPTGQPTTVVYRESWPAYQLEETTPIRVALTQAARHHLPSPPPAKVAGPSNIGNYLASLGVDATAGLGVAYHGLHGTDERIDISTIPMIQATYHEAIHQLMTRPG